MYESFFRLREPPFSLAPDPRFLWPSETHLEGLNALYYGITARKGFVLLTGDVGTGKTTLLRAMLERLPPDTQTGVIFNTSELRSLDLLRLIADELGIQERMESKSDYTIALNALLIDRMRSGVNTVLIIDEAQDLESSTLQELRQLSNLETDTEKLLQIVLTGQPELRAKLASPKLRSLRQRIALEHHIEPLLPIEVFDYLRHRVHTAGGRYEEVFAPGAEEVFFSFSSGCPRLINLLADRSLLSAFSKQLRPVPRALVELKAKEIAAAQTAGRNGDVEPAEASRVERDPQLSLLDPEVARSSCDPSPPTIGGVDLGEITEALREARRRRPDPGEGEVAWTEDGPTRPPDPGAEPRRDPTPSHTPADAERDRSAGVHEARIPRSQEGDWHSRTMILKPSAVASERLRHFALQVRQELERRQYKSVIVTSAVRAEGKTFTSCNLALALASMAGARRIALVDLDLRRPSVATAMHVPPPLGLERVLAEEAPLSAACVRTDIPSLDLFLVEKPVAFAHELLSGPGLKAVLGELTRRYGMVICDAPPVLLAPDAQLLSALVDGCLAIARAGTTRRSELREMLALLPRDKLIGTFLNRARLGRRTYGYQRYGSGDDEGEAEAVENGAK